MRAARTRICRRDQRSMNTPANGPISEYGRYRTAKAAAAAPRLGDVALLKKTDAPTPAGAGARVGERRLVEEDVRADPRSECPVPGLGDQPGREQTAETPFGQDASQLGEERRARYAPAQLPSARGQHRHPFSLRRAGCWPARPLSSAKVSRCAVQRLRQRSTSPRMNFSTRSWATSSPYCSGGG